MEKREKKSTSARRTAGVRRVTTRSWGFERLEERTVLSAAGSVVVVYVIDLSHVRGWEPTQISKAPTQGNQVVQKSTMRLDNGTVVLLLANPGSRRGPGGGEDAPEGESSANDPINAALKARAPETLQTSAMRTPVSLPSPTAPLQPVFSREASASSGTPLNSSKAPTNSIPSATPVVNVGANTASAVPRQALLMPATDATSGSLFSDSRLGSSAQSGTVRADSGSPSLGQSDLLQRTGDAATGELVEPQVSYDAGQSAESHAVDGIDAGDEAWLPINRTKRLRRNMPMPLKSPAVQVAMQQLVRQFPSTELWGFRLDVDPAAELAQVLGAEAARRVALPHVPQVPENEGGTVAITVEDITASLPEPGSVTRRVEPQATGEEVVSLQDIEVRMEFSAERYQAFDVSTEPQQATDPSREVALGSP